MTNTLVDAVADKRGLWKRKKKIAVTLPAFWEVYLPKWEECIGISYVDGGHHRTVGKGRTAFSEFMVEGFGIE